MFTDRADAGARLADTLDERGVTADVVLGITRGGVPVARVVADRLGCPLGTIVVQKIGTPGREELALGAVTSDGTAWINDGLVDSLGIAASELERRREEATATATEKASRYRADRSEPSIDGRAVLVVDDGVATGATARAALTAVRERGASSVAFGVPVAAPSSLQELRELADTVVCVETPEPFGAVGRHYQRFEQVTDEDVRAALA